MKMTDKHNTECPQKADSEATDSHEAISGGVVADSDELLNDGSFDGVELIGQWITGNSFGGPHSSSLPFYATSTPEERPTLRDQFAMAALTGLISDPEALWPSEEFADLSYKLADAMMKAREK